MKGECVNREGGNWGAGGHIARSERHCRLLDSYLLNLDRGVGAVRSMIAGDLRRFTEMGANRYAADLAIVLDCFVAEVEGAGAIGCEPAA